jgi:hypothetical protein
MSSNWKDLVQGRGLKERFLLSCAHLTLGETSRTITCPSCGTSDKDFTVTRVDDGVIFNCYRSKCGLKGSMKFGGFIPPDIQEMKKKVKPPFNRYTGEIDTLTEQEKHNLHILYHIPVKHIDIEGWGVSRFHLCKRLILPIYNQLGNKIGIESKYVKGWSHNEEKNRKEADELAGSKSLIFWDHPEDYTFRLHFPKVNSGVPFLNKKDNSQVFVVVEDIPSAVSVGPYIPTIALLGSSINKSTLNFFHNKSLIFCLDDDATTKAIDIIKKYMTIFSHAHLIPLKKDPKNMTENEIISDILNKVEL